MVITCFLTTENDFSCNDGHPYYLSKGYKDINPLPEDMIDKPLFVVKPDWSDIEEGNDYPLFKDTKALINRTLLC